VKAMKKKGRASIGVHRAGRFLARLMVALSAALLLSSCVGISHDTSEREVDAKSRASKLGSQTNDDAALDLLPVGALVGDVLMQQRVTVHFGDRNEGFDAVFQKRGPTLLLLGLGPMNTVGFRLTYDDHEVLFENRTGREMPFRPERILSDVQRVFYPWIRQSPLCFECKRSEILGELEVRERIGTRFLEERSFRLVDEPERGRVVIRYGDWTGDPAFPRQVTLDNGWFGYALTIETTSAESLD
jgi:hypothetical protein